MWYRGPKAIGDAIGYAKFYSRSHDAVIRVYDAAGNEIETHQHAGEFKSGELLLSSHRSSAKPGTGHWLLVAYTVYFNRRHRWSGHLFQGRYKSFLVQEGDYLLGLSRYVHLNPVRGVSLGRGTPSERRKRLRAFRWSSYRGYAGLSAPFPFVQETMVLDELRGPRRAERLRYRRFVEKGLLREVENPFEAVQ